MPRTENDQKEIVRVPPSVKKSGTARRVSWPFFIFLFILFGLTLFLFTVKKRDPLSSGDQPTVTPKIVKFGAFHWNNPEYPFALAEYAQLVPAKVDLYFESRGLADFFKIILAKESQKQLETILGLDLTEAESYFEGTFAFVQQSTASAVLAKIKDRDFVEKKMKEIEAAGAPKEFQFILIGEDLIVSDSPPFLAEIKEVSRRERLNLNLSAAFAEGARNLPGRGQAFIFAPNRPGLLAFIKQIVGSDYNEIKSLQLKGSAFILEATGGESSFRGINDE